MERRLTLQFYVYGAPQTWEDFSLFTSTQGFDEFIQCLVDFGGSGEQGCRFIRRQLGERKDRKSVV